MIRVDPVSDHEHYWWDISTTYLDYVVDTLSQWRNSPDVRSVELIPFHAWRHDEDGAYRARIRDARSPAAELCTCEHQRTISQRNETSISPTIEAE